MPDIDIKWLITSRKFEDCNIKSICSRRGFVFYSSKDCYIRKHSGDDVIILLDGFVLPKCEYEHLYAYESSLELVFDLFTKYGKNLTSYIKGNFTLIIVYKEEFYIINDQLGLSKYFYSLEADDFVISNKYSFVSGYVNSVVNPNSITNFVLFQHFMNGETFIKDILYTSEGTLWYFKNKLFIEKYWSSDDLIKCERGEISYKHFAESFNNIINKYIQFLKPVGVSLTLTGGRDTRTILSSLLNNGIKPDVFTFGNPKSADVISSTEISDKIGLEFSNYFMEPKEEWYHKLLTIIINNDNPLVHIHRAHRIDAYMRDISSHKNEMVIMGSMGGDYIKGAHLDDYIITKFVRQWYFENQQNDDTLYDNLLPNYLRNSSFAINDLKDCLSNMGFSDGIFKNMEFNIVQKLVAELHDYQDIFLASRVYKYCITPFLDIDFLYLLFSSKYSLFNNAYSSGNPFKMLKGSELQCEIIDELYSDLSDINFASGYAPKDVLGNNINYILKRIYLQKIKRTKYEHNFSYTEWFRNMIEMNIHKIELMNDIFDVDSLKIALKSDQHKTTEGYWHKYSNILMFGLLREYYGV